MIRRLSNFKSTTNQQQTKCLLDYSYFDHELYGCENKGCIDFNTTEEDIDDTFDDLINDPYNGLEDSLETTRQNTNEKSFGVLAVDSDSSDSDSGSPLPQKKGLRRFFCMPKKSRSTPKLTSSAGNSLRRSLRRSKRKDTSLIDSEA